MPRNIILIFGIVSFLLFFTYFTTGVLYSDQTSVRANTVYSDEDVDMPQEFNLWINQDMERFLYYMHYTYTGGLWSHYGDDTNKIYCFLTFFLDREHIMSRFDFSQSGLTYYEWCINNKVVYANNIQYEYNIYLRLEYDLKAEFDKTTGDFTKFEKWQGGLIEQTFEFLSIIPKGLITIADIASFNIEVPTTDLDGNEIGTEQAIPQDVKNIMMVFIIPLWLIMFLCLFLIIPDFLQGIGALIPWT